MKNGVINARQVEELIDEKLSIEALCQSVEHLQFNDELAVRIATAIKRLRQRQNRGLAVIPKMQSALREMKLDLELIKHALVALKQTGVLNREQIEAELVREVFPPNRPNAAYGVVVVEEKTVPVAAMECQIRLHICKAICCRIFPVHLTAREVHSNLYRWNPKQPYSLRKNRLGCIHLEAGTCRCNIYAERPQICQSYSCREDKRVWQDFDRMILNPGLFRQIRSLDVSTDLWCAVFTEEQFREDALNEGKRLKRIKKGHGIASSQEPSLHQHALREPKSPSGNVSPPDFSDLRALLDTEPHKRFVPQDVDRADPGEGKGAADSKSTLSGAK